MIKRIELRTDFRGKLIFSNHIRRNKNIIKERVI